MFNSVNQLQLVQLDHPLRGLLVEARLGVVVRVVDGDDLAALVRARAGATPHVLLARAHPVCRARFDERESVQNQALFPSTRGHVCRFQFT